MNACSTHFHYFDKLFHNLTNFSVIILSLCWYFSEYLAVFITQGATTEAQQDLKDALFVTQVKALPITHPFLQHMQDPFTLHFVLEKNSIVTLICVKQTM